MQVPTHYDDVRLQLMPALRRLTDPPRAWVMEGESALIRRVVLPMVHELVVLDRPDGRVFVDHTMANLWKQTPEVLLDQARRNLSDVGAGSLQARKEYGLWQLTAPDAYPSSRLLLPGWLAAFTDRVHGRPVAVMPAPNILLVGGDGSPGQIDRLLQLAFDAFRTAASGLSPVPYTVDGQNRVEPWGPSDHAHTPRSLLAQRLLEATVYADQQDQLGILAQDVPAVRLIRGDDATHTVASWGPTDEGTLLPEVDQYDIEGLGPVDARAARSHLPDLFVDTGWEPRRWLAHWPTADQLIALAPLVRTAASPPA